MKEFLQQLCVIGISVGTLLIREVIALILRYIKVPKLERHKKKLKKRHDKLNRLKNDPLTRKLKEDEKPWN